MASKYRYAVEIRQEANGEWYPIVRGETQDFCMGYVLALRDAPPPRAARRVVRSDGKVIDQAEHDHRVALGMVAGFPTPEQYESAARDAIEKAAHIRLMDYARDARTLAKEALVVALEKANDA